MEIKGLEIEVVLNNLIRISSEPVPQVNSAQFKLAYRVKRVLDKLKSVYEDLEKKRVILVKKYGVADKVKNTVNVTPENMDIFTKERDSLYYENLNIDVELIPLELIQASGIKINLIELAVIERFVDKPKEA